MAGNRDGVILVFTLIIGTRLRCYLYGPTALPYGKDPLNTLGRMVAGYRSRSRLFGNKEKNLPLPKTEIRFLFHSLHSLVTIQTELTQQT